MEGCFDGLWGFIEVCVCGKFVFVYVLNVVCVNVVGYVGEIVEIGIVKCCWWEKIIVV